MPVYKSVGAFASLEPGTVAGLVPILLGRRPSEELIAIATGPKGPVHYSIWPLADLYTEVGCDRFETALATAPATGIWLVGSSADLTNVAAAAAGLLDFLETPKWSEHWKAIALTADGRQWGFIDDHVDQTDPDQLHTVPDLDPLWSNLTALAVKAKCASALDLAALGVDGTQDEEVLATERLVARLRSHTPDGNQAIQGIEDEASLLAALDAGDPVTVAEAINLGCALAASPHLVATAVDRLLTAAPDRLGTSLWCQIVRHTSGQAQSLAATLAGLAAWRTGDLAAACAAITVAYADRSRQPAAQVLAEMVWTGVAAEAVMPRTGEESHGLASASSPVLPCEGPQSEEVA
nr:DUF4192 family protein [Glycomyces amatae]